MRTEPTATKLDVKKVDWRGLILGLAMVMMGCYGITIGAPLVTSDADVVRWGGLVLAVLGVWVLWTAVNDAYEASRE